MESVRCLVDDHAELAGVVAQFNALLNEKKLRAAFERLDFFWARLAVHIRAEHHRLFPALREVQKESCTGKGGRPTVARRNEALAALRVDHDFFMDELAWAVNTFKGLCERPGDRTESDLIEEIRRRVGGVTSRLEPHNRLEEEEVYRWPDLLLGAEHRRELAAAMQGELANLPPRFRLQGRAG